MSDPEEPSGERSASQGVPWRLALGLGGLAVAASAYLAFRPPLLPASGLSFEPTAAERLKMEQLRSHLSNKHRQFESADVRQADNAKLFAYMAATSRDPIVLEASLEAIQLAYSSRSDKTAFPDADLEKVLLQRAQSDNPKVASLALSALRTPLMAESPRIELVQALCDQYGAATDGARRMALIEALDLLGPELRIRPVIQVFQTAVGAPESYVAARSLRALTNGAESVRRLALGDKAHLGLLVASVIQHAEPAVRGLGLHLLAEVEGLASSEEVSRYARALLQDPNGYVRGEAILAMGPRPSVEDARSLVALTRDLGSTKYIASGWTRLDGKPGEQTFSVPGRTRVGEVALFALREMSQKLQGPARPPLVLALKGPQWSEAEVLESAARAEAWFSKAELTWFGDSATPESTGVPTSR